MAASKRYNTYFEEFRRYDSGEMSYAEQFSLEKRMLDDPFFAEAYEGYLAALSDGVDGVHWMTELESELENRVTGKTRRLVPSWIYATAASIVFALSWVFYLSREGEDSFNTSSNLVMAPAAKSDSVTIAASAERPPVNTTTANLAVGQDLKASSTRPHPKNSSTIPGSNDRLAMSDHATQGVDYSAKMATRREQEVVAVQHGNLIDASRDSVKKEPNAIALSYLGEERPAAVHSNVHISHGRVVNATGRGVPGVLVSIPRSQSTFYTDSLGKFSISIPKPDSLKLTGIGYRSKLVAANKPELGVIMLEDDLNALSEVVVVGYGKPAKRLSGAGVKVNASPTGGWEQYKVYLAQATQNARQRGKIKIQFKVNEDGTLTDFRTKGNQQLREDAIKIVHQGPTWNPAKRNELKISDTVSIDLSFE